jgi:hypothetical protein
LEQDYSRELQAKVELPQSGLLLRTVHEIYHRQFWRWFGIMAPTSLLATTVLVLGEHGVAAIFSGIPRGGFLTHLPVVAEALLLQFARFFLAWLLACFALAAIATAFEDKPEDEEDVVWRHDSYQRARENLGRIFLIALVTFGCVVVGATGMLFVGLTIAKKLGLTGIGFYYPATTVGMILIAGIVSWLGAAIPIVLRGEKSIATALRESVKLSNGYEGALFLLVVEILLGGLLAGLITIRALDFIVPSYLHYASWYGWLARLVGSAVAAALESPLFIGYSLLANPRLFKPATGSATPAHLTEIG